MRRLLLFARRPRLGRVKTRFVPPLTAEQAVRLYRAFLIDQLEFLRASGGAAEREWCVDGPLDAVADADLPVHGLRVELQGSGNLGSRLLRAFRRCHREGATATVILGADSPTLPAESVDAAFGELERGARAVIAPAEDGGYVLLGMREPVAELLREIPWGAAEVTSTTRRRAMEVGVRLVEIEPWYDVDDIVGLQRLRRELREPSAARRAPATAACLVDWALPPVV